MELEINFVPKDFELPLLCHPSVTGTRDRSRLFGDVFCGSFGGEGLVNN